MAGWKITFIFEGDTSSTGGFSIVMLVFRGVFVSAGSLEKYLKEALRNPYFWL